MRSHERAPGAGSTGGVDQAGARSDSSISAGGDTSAQSAPYQLLPPLSEAEYAALRDSIAEHGVRVPIEVDEHGTILDGHHRSAIAADLGIDCPQVVVSTLDTEQDKRTHALSLNLTRRHLSREQLRDVIAASITADPDLSDREHARRCGCSPTTVGTVRRSLEVSNLDTPMSRAEAEQRLARIQEWLDELSEHLRVISMMLTDCGVPQAVAHEMVRQLDRDVHGMVCAPSTASPDLIARRFDDVLALVPGLRRGGVR